VELSINGIFVMLKSVVVIQVVQIVNGLLMVLSVILNTFILIYSVLLRIHVTALFIFNLASVLIQAVVREGITKSAVGQMVAPVLVRGVIIVSENQNS